MGMRLFVGNLPFNSTEDEIRTVFEKHGQVKDCHIVMDYASGRSKGFCFVEMSTREEATTAIEQLNGVDFNGRQLNVSEAKPKVDFKSRPLGSDSRVNNVGKDRW